MTIELFRPFPSWFEADTETVILPVKGKHESGREETQVFEQVAGEMRIEAQVSPIIMSLKVTV